MKNIILCLILILATSLIFCAADRTKISKAYRLLNSRQFPDAIEMLEELYDDDENNVRLRNTLATAYNNYATMLRTQKNEDSFDYYEKALKLSPSQPALRFNYASGLYDLEKYEDAIYQLEYSYSKITGKNRQQADMLLGLSYFKLNDYSRAGYYFDEVDSQKTPAVYFYKGFLKYKLGQISEAISIWKEFASKHPGHASRFKIANWVKKANTENKVEKKFSQDTTSHFMVNCDVDDKKIDLDFILTAFEEAYYDVGRDLKIYPKNRIPVVIYSSHKQYRNATNSPEWTGGLWDGTKIRIPSSMCRSGKDILKRTIFHEYVHLLLSTKYEKDYRNLPIWLNEGCAEYVSHTLLGKKIRNLKLTDNAINTLNAFYTNPAYFRSVKTARSAYRLALHSVRFIIEEYGYDGLLKLIDNMVKRRSRPFYNSLSCTRAGFIENFIEFMK